jgi:hypothetical protein
MLCSFVEPLERSIPQLDLALTDDALPEQDTRVVPAPVGTTARTYG